MYEQSLYKIIEPVKKTTISRLNKGKKWKHGYNKEHDIIVISKTGKIGEILEIQNLRIGLPLEPMQVHMHKSSRWEKIDYPKELGKLKNIFDWRAYPEEQKEQAMEVVEKVEHELKEVDTIESALAGVENLTANDKEMDDIAKKSEDSFNNLMDLGMNVEARFSGQIFDTASKMLTITLNAKQAKIDKKLKMVELQLRKKALDARIDRDMGKLDGAENGEATILSRNELLDKILKKDNK